MVARLKLKVSKWVSKVGEKSLASLSKFAKATLSNCGNLLKLYIPSTC